MRPRASSKAVGSIRYRQAAIAPAITGLALGRKTPGLLTCAEPEVLF